MDPETAGRIRELIDQWPDVDLGQIENDLLIVMASEYLTRRRAELYSDHDSAEEVAEMVAQVEHNRELNRTRRPSRDMERRAVERANRAEELKAKMDAIVAEHSAALIAQWTPANLDITFRLPGGEEVTWGDATVEQHSSIVAHAKSTAQSAIDRASMHQKAIDDIRNAGVSTLREAV